MSKPLPEEISKRIKIEAQAVRDRVCSKEFTLYQQGLSDGVIVGYTHAAESYATQYLAEKERADQLERWKAEATEVMAPIFDWFHSQKDIPLGSRMGTVILERLEAYDKMEAALKEIQLTVHQEDDLNGFREWIKKQANLALSTQTDNKTEDNGK
jgi:hypothetical protein